MVRAHAGCIKLYWSGFRIRRAVGNEQQMHFMQTKGSSWILDRGAGNGSCLKFFNAHGHFVASFAAGYQKLLTCNFLPTNATSQSSGPRWDKRPIQNILAKRRQTLRGSTPQTNALSLDALARDDLPLAMGSRTTRALPSQHVGRHGPMPCWFYMVLHRQAPNVAENILLYTTGLPIHGPLVGTQPPPTAADLFKFGPTHCIIALERMGATILNWNPGQRRVGRPKNRWTRKVQTFCRYPISGDWTQMNDAIGNTCQDDFAEWCLLQTYTSKFLCRKWPPPTGVQAKVEVKKNQRQIQPAATSRQ